MIRLLNKFIEAKDMYEFIKKLPKAELHIHIEGTLEPEMAFMMAQRNDIELPFESVEELEKQYEFNGLSDFLSLFDIVSQALVTELDFYELTMSYLSRAAREGVCYVEFFFSVQGYVERGISFETIFNGIYSAICDAKKFYGIEAHPILCFLRHYSEESAFEALNNSRSHRDKIIAVGLAGHEEGNPPSKFIGVMQEASRLGYNITVHAGEESGPDYIWQAIKLLGAQRIDHGVSCLQDSLLVDYLVQNQIPLTLCPLSNLALKIVDSLDNYYLQDMLNLGLLVSINSDDPVYFGGYIVNNYIKVAKALSLSKENLIVLAQNSFLSSFASEKTKAFYLARIDNYLINSVDFI